jgi:hypothetical protein
MAWYCTKNFFVRGGVELRKLDNSELQLIHDPYGNECLKLVFLTFPFLFFVLIPDGLVLLSLFLSVGFYDGLQIYTWLHQELEN